MKTFNVYGARVYHAESGDHRGMTVLPKSFVAIFGARMLVVGDPPRDVIQWALSEAGFVRLAITRLGQGGYRDVKGLLVNALV